MRLCQPILVGWSLEKNKKGKFAFISKICFKSYVSTIRRRLLMDYYCQKNAKNTTEQERFLYYGENSR